MLHGYPPIEHKIERRFEISLSFGYILYYTCYINVYISVPNFRPVDEMDWGVFQLDAVMDKKDITGSHFLVLTNFGDHALHHLFPTIDHGQLEYLHPYFQEVCEKFGLEWRRTSTMELAKGQFRQLVKTKPNNKISGSTKSNVQTR